MTPLIDVIRKRQAAAHAQRNRASGTRVSVQFGADIFESGNNSTAYWLLLPLFVFHCTLSVIVRKQYLQEVDSLAVLKDAAPAIPFFFVVQKYVHPRRVHLLAKLSILSVGVSSAAYCVYISNREGYFASMSKLPPIGTLIIWVVLELPWEYDATLLILTAAYMKYTGFSI